MATEGPINILENSLRDLIELVLRNQHGSAWADHLGITPDRMAEWKRRRDEERKKRTAGAIEERILYYSDFTDLFLIIKKNWDSGFKTCFGDQAELRVYMGKLAHFRNPDAHSRPLLPAEQQLMLGMTAELRQKITLFLSKGGGGPEPERFARIEELIDSFGNRGIGEASGGSVCHIDLILRPGDVILFRGQAWDQADSPLRWKLLFSARRQTVEAIGAALEYEWSISKDDIGEQSLIIFTVISGRSYHRFPVYGGDDRVVLFYKVLPR